MITRSKRIRISKEDRPSPSPPSVKKSRTTKKTQSVVQQVSPRVRDNWGSFHKLPNPDPAFMGDFHISSRMMVDGDPAIARIFCILRYHLPTHQGPCYQLMYRTSGSNTHKKGTWFPCNGVVSDYDSGDVYYSKLNNTKFSKAMEGKSDLLKELMDLGLSGMNTREKLLNELMRFGTPQFLFASFLMGGGLWKDPRIVAILAKHFAMPLEAHADHKEINVTDTILITNPAMMLNEYAGYALSFNYFKSDQYKTPSAPWIDYRKWYAEPQEIGRDSPQAKAIARFFPNEKQKPCMENLYYEDPATHDKYILSICLNINLETINCEQLVAMMKTNIKRLTAHLAKEKHEQKS